MKLIDWMKKRNVSYRVMARWVGVSPMSIVRYVNGLQRPGVKSLKNIIHVTDGHVTAEDFLKE